MPAPTTSAMRIPLRARDGSVRAEALVDPDDFVMLSEYYWHLSADGYVMRNSKSGPLYLHREILGLVVGDGKVVDHINGDPLDNRRANLRVGSQADNIANRTRLNANNLSGHRGVSYDRGRGLWKAQVQLAGKFHFLGRFADIDAADEAVRAFRKQNMPFSAEASA